MMARLFIGGAFREADEVKLDRCLDYQTLKSIYRVGPSN